MFEFEFWLAAIFEANCFFFKSGSTVRGRMRGEVRLTPILKERKGIGKVGKKRK